MIKRQNEEISIEEFVRSSAITLHRVSDSRYLVFTPFEMSDGDHLTIILKKDGDRWILSDEAHTLMTLSYHLSDKSLQSVSRRTIIDSVVKRFGLFDWNGELVMAVDMPRLESHILRFGQALIQICDVMYLEREHVRSTFKEDVENFVERVVAPEQFKRSWFDPDQDPDKKYIVDVRIEATIRPIFLFMFSTTQNVMEATISILNFDAWDLDFDATGVVNPDANIAHNAMSKFQDAPRTNRFDFTPVDTAALQNFIGERMAIN